MRALPSLHVQRHFDEPISIENACCRDPSYEEVGSSNSNTCPQPQTQGVQPHILLPSLESTRFEPGQAAPTAKNPVTVGSSPGKEEGGCQDTREEECPGIQAPYRIVTLGCGAGGGQLAISELLQHVQTVLAVDNDEGILEFHRYNFPAVPTVCGNVRATSTRLQVVEIKPDLTLVTMSCKPFSAAGNRNISSAEAYDTKVAVNVAIAANSKVIVVEQVKNFRKTPVYHRVNEALLANGYLVTSHYLSGSDVGMATTRDRLFIVAKRVTEQGAEEAVKQLWRYHYSMKKLREQQKSPKAMREVVPTMPETVLLSPRRDTDRVVWSTLRAAPCFVGQHAARVIPNNLRRRDNDDGAPTEAETLTPKQMQKLMGLQGLKPVPECSRTRWIKAMIDTVHPPVLLHVLRTILLSDLLEGPRITHVDAGIGGMVGSADGMNPPNRVPRLLQEALEKAELVGDTLLEEEEEGNELNVPGLHVLPGVIGRTDNDSSHHQVWVKVKLQNSPESEHVMLDTGSGYTFCSEVKAKQLEARGAKRQPLQAGEPTAMTQADNHSILEVLGRFDFVPMEGDDHVLRVTPQVFILKGLAVPMLVGRYGLTEMGAILNMPENRVEWIEAPDHLRWSMVSAPTAHEQGTREQMGSILEPYFASVQALRRSTQILDYIREKQRTASQIPINTVSGPSAKVQEWELGELDRRIMYYPPKDPGWTRLYVAETQVIPPEGQAVVYIKPDPNPAKSPSTLVTAAKVELNPIFNLRAGGHMGLPDPILQWSVGEKDPKPYSFVLINPTMKTLTLSQGTQIGQLIELRPLILRQTRACTEDEVVQLRRVVASSDLTHLNHSKQEEVRRLHKKWEIVFAADTKSPGTTTLIQLELDTGQATPIRAKAFHYSATEEEALQKRQKSFCSGVL